ncbi:MAG TPA: hypothetical protein DDW98_05060, partial [Gammaproteobacteria bacterium]|nr:hypothetical protein [Gammaproteobacteria bacterium]
MVSRSPAQVKRDRIHCVRSHLQLTDRRISLERFIFPAPAAGQIQDAHPQRFHPNLTRGSLELHLRIVLRPVGTRIEFGTSTCTRPQIGKIRYPQTSLHRDLRPPSAGGAHPRLTRADIQLFQCPFGSRTLQRQPTLNRASPQSPLHRVDLQLSGQPCVVALATGGSIERQSSRPARVERTRIESLPTQGEIPGQLRRPRDLAASVQSTLEQIARLDPAELKRLPIPLACQGDAGLAATGPSARQARLQAQVIACRLAADRKLAFRTVQRGAGPAQRLPGQIGLQHVGVGATEHILPLPPDPTDGRIQRQTVDASRTGIHHAGESGIPRSLRRAIGMQCRLDIRG